MFQSTLSEKLAFFMVHAFDALKLLVPAASSPGPLGPQISCMKRFEVGPMRSAGMTLPGNGARVAVLVATLRTVVVGSKMVRRAPARFSDFEKSPVRSRSVGWV